MAKLSLQFVQWQQCCCAQIKRSESFASDNRYVSDYPQSLVPLAPSVVRFTGPKAHPMTKKNPWFFETMASKI